MRTRSIPLSPSESGAQFNAITYPSLLRQLCTTCHRKKHIFVELTCRTISKPNSIFSPEFEPECFHSHSFSSPLNLVSMHACRIRHTVWPIEFQEWCTIPLRNEINYVCVCVWYQRPTNGHPSRTFESHMLGVQSAKYVVNLISIELSVHRQVCNCCQTNKGDFDSVADHFRTPHSMVRASIKFEWIARSRCVRQPNISTQMPIECERKADTSPASNAEQFHFNGLSSSHENKFGKRIPDSAHEIIEIVRCGLINER